MSAFEFVDLGVLVVVAGLIVAAILGIVVWCVRLATTVARDPDLAQLARLRASGADLSRPANIRFILSLPDGAKASRLARRLGRIGLSAGVMRAGDGVNWLCVVTIQMVPELREVRRLSLRLSRVAAAAGGTCDLWEAVVTS